jgi:hypothetical protein
MSGDQAHEWRGPQFSIHNEPLTRLNIQAHFNSQFRVLVQFGFKIVEHSILAEK